MNQTVILRSILSALLLSVSWSVAPVLSQPPSIQSEELLRALEVVNTQIKKAHQDIQHLDGRVSPVADVVRNLTDQLAAMRRPPEKEKEQRPEARRREVTYRLPKKHKSTKPNAVFLIFQDRRVTLQHRSLGDEIKRHYGQVMQELKAAAPGKKTWKGTLQVSGTHFDLKYEYVLTGIQYSNKGYELLRKPGSTHVGETLEQFTEADSEVSRAIRKADPKTTTIQQRQASMRLPVRR